MPQQLTVAVENNFTKGLITESTGLNFPENAATDTSNCLYTLVGDVTRRLGINNEPNYASNYISVVGASNSYVWANPGGDSSARLEVKQVASTLYFYDVAATTITSPLSQHKLATTVNLLPYAVSAFDTTVECTFTEGNGYLFVFHPSCSPVYVTYSAGTLTSAPINVQIRDFIGADEGSVAVNNRPTTLTAEHNYNLVNQGWISGSPWSAQSVGPNPSVALGSQTFTIPSGIAGIVNGQTVSVVTVDTHFPGGVQVTGGTNVMGGTVTSYVGTTLTLNVTGIGNSSNIPGSALGPYLITPVNTGYLNTWFTAEGNYPSNADVWWYFKNASNVFDPATTANNVTLNTGYGPRGHYILDAFNQTRSIVSGVAGITNITTTTRPSNGTWFRGRVWYTGVNANQPAQGDALFYSWSSNIYFSQVVQTTRDFGSCFQTNDPTSETLLDILPTDGGVITIPESGVIFKLFPIANGLLVFASNGVWFITGSQGIGFAANDYTVTKLSSIRSISTSSYVDVNGLPFFWNEEGIYQVAPQQGGSLSVEPITVGTILAFYNAIPLASKRYVKGAYDPIEYVIQWVYRSTSETGIVDRYHFDTILNFNTYNKAFYPYTVSTTNNQSYINGINYIAYPVINLDTPEPGIKYLSSFNTGITYSHQFAEEYDEDYLDWGSVDYDSFFITGYKLRGQAIKRFQPQYVQMWYRTNDGPTAYKIQGLWDYANDANSNRWTKPQIVDVGLGHYTTAYKRHKLRGHGYALQLKISSLPGKPFDIQGWAIVDTVNAGT